MADLETFRAETRAWLKANCPPEVRGPRDGDEDYVWGGRNPVFKTPAHKVWLAVDVGKALNPLAVEGQAQGGVWMGMGQALSEETRWDEGRMLHGNLLDYRFPTMAESPDIEVIIVESIDPNGPFGAKEASEGMLAGFLPAVADAVHEAVGVRALEFPLSPDRVLDLIDARDAAAARAAAKAMKGAAA